MVPTSAGRQERRFPDRLSSVSEGMSHSTRGNSDRALLDRLRLLSLQNLERKMDDRKLKMERDTGEQSEKNR